MTLTEAIQARIKGLCEEHDMTLNKLSYLCGITQSTLENIYLRPNNRPSVSTIKKICDGLEITLGEFFSHPLFDELEQEIK